MKKVFVSLAAIASFGLFINSASATCVVGCDINDQLSGNHHNNGGLADVGFSAKASWEGVTGANSESMGSGNHVNESTNFTYGDQTTKYEANATRSTGLPGSGCSGACQDNHGRIMFETKMNAGALATHHAESNNGYGAANSYTGAGGAANFSFSMK